MTSNGTTDSIPLDSTTWHFRRDNGTVVNSPCNWYVKICNYTPDSSGTDGPQTAIKEAHEWVYRNNATNQYFPVYDTLSIGDACWHPNAPPTISGATLVADVHSHPWPIRTTIPYLPNTTGAKPCGGMAAVRGLSSPDHESARKHPNVTYYSIDDQIVNMRRYNSSSPTDFVEEPDVQRVDTTHNCAFP